MKRARTLAVALAMVAALACAVFSGSTAHAAAMSSLTTPLSHPSATPMNALASCQETYWDYGWQNPPGADGFQWEFGTYFLRDAYSGSYCGQIKTRVCVTTPYTWPLIWRLANDTYPNQMWGDRSIATIDIHNAPYGTQGYGCAYSQQYGVGTGNPIVIQAHLWGVDGNNYGGTPLDVVFYAY